MLVQNLVDLAVEIQQIPAPTFHEQARADFVYKLFQKEGLVDGSIDSAGNVYGCLKGKTPGLPAQRAPSGAGKTPIVVVSAHLDTVFPQETNLRVRREHGRIMGPGVGDNSLGVAALLGLVWSIQQERKVALPGDVWLVANVGEEGLGNLKGMSAIVDRFGSNALAYIILEGMSLGQVFHRGLGVARYRITTRTAGGHSWVDYGRPSAIHELAALITHLTALRLSKKPRTTLNVGVINGGTTVNTIASQASLELDLRSESAIVLKNLSNDVERLVIEANRENVEVFSELIGSRPVGQIPVTHPLVKIARRCLEYQGIKPHLSIGSTDANLPLSRGLPAICIGLTHGAGAHTIDEYFTTEPLSRGLAQLHMLVETILRELPANG